MAEAEKFLCVEETCQKTVASTKNSRYRTHKKPDGEPCPMSSEEIPPREIEAGPMAKDADPGVPEEGRDFAVCKRCGRAVKLTLLGYFENHDKPDGRGVRCMNGGTRWRRPMVDVVPDLPETIPVANPNRLTTTSLDPTLREGVLCEVCGETRPPMHMVHQCPGSPESEKAETAWVPPSDESALVELLKSELGATEILTILQPGPPLSPESTDTSSGSAAVESLASPMAQFSLGTSYSASIMQPMSPFLQPVEIPPEAPQTSPGTASAPSGTVSGILQPPEYKGAVKGEPMGDLAKQLATQVKETFYAYSNRKTSDNRSAQVTLGPSEIGTPCDRRLAMALLGVTPVNAGGDGWAAFVGTMTHVGMGEVYTFADAGTGRYAVEMPVFLGIPTVPRGTTDLLDRRDGTVIDWKVMGAYSLKKFKEEGPSLTYRTQAHTYGLGAERGGEKVRNVAIVGLPRAGSSLDEMHIWTERYDKKFAQAALDRVERLANSVRIAETQQATWEGLDINESKVRIARDFGTADDCRFCEFHLKGDKAMKRGCPGK